MTKFLDQQVTNMLRFVDPNSAKMTVRHNVKQKTYPLHEAARRGHVKIMMVMQFSLSYDKSYNL